MKVLAINPVTANIKKLVNLTMILSLTTLSSLAVAGGNNGDGTNSGGGGDEYTRDLVAIANLEVAPWLVLNGSKLVPPVDAKDFTNAVNPKSMASVVHVYESCVVKLVNLGKQDQHLESVPSGAKDREVEVCYNKEQDFYYISRTFYPLHDQNSPAKRGNIAHEILRKMHLEGDKYEVSKQISILQVPNSLTKNTQAETTEELRVRLCSGGEIKSEYEAQLAMDICKPVDLNAVYARIQVLESEIVHFRKQVKDIDQTFARQGMRTYLQLDLQIPDVLLISAGVSGAAFGYVGGMLNIVGKSAAGRPPMVIGGGVLAIALLGFATDYLDNYLRDEFQNKLSVTPEMLKKLYKMIDITEADLEARKQNLGEMMRAK